MKIEQILIGMLLLGAIITGMYFFIGDLSQSYGISFSENKTGTYDETDAILSEIEDSYEDMTSRFSVDEDASFFTGVVKAIKTIKNIVIAPYNLFVGLINSFFENEAYNFPDWIAPLIVALLGIGFTFALFAAVLRWNV